jgi:hypothetical protein
MAVRAPSRSILGGFGLCLIVAAAGLHPGCGGKAVIDGSAPGSGGSEPTSCSDIHTAYLEQLALARSCSPEMSVEQCTFQIDTDLGCPCPTYVNPANSSPVFQLLELRNAWNEQGCTEDGCDAGICPTPDGSACLPQGPGSGSGVCTDMFTSW